MTYFALSATGPDEPGIVAMMTDALFKLGCNIESSLLSILGGSHFAVIFVVNAQSTREELQGALAASDGVPHLSNVSVSEVDGYRSRGSRDGTHQVEVVTVKDRPGVLRAVSQSLAEQNVNIVDLCSDVLQLDPERCAMVLTVAFPEGLNESTLQSALEAVLQDAEVPLDDFTVRVAPVDMAR